MRQLTRRYIRATITTEFASFHRFRDGDNEIFNPGGNEAFIQQTTAPIDYGLTERLTVSMLVPHIRKVQHTNRFGRRKGEGVGDIAALGFYEIIPRSGVRGGRRLR